MIIDNHNRQVNYVRLAVTDRCNLRCFYCMPEEGTKYMKREELISYEEMLRLMAILAKHGVNKVRITGGEPFLRKDLDGFLLQLSEIPGVEKISITTNGTLTTPYIPTMKKAGITSVNLSLDTLDKARFFSITRRDEYDKVMECFYALLEAGIGIKVNMVVMDGINDVDILPMLELAKNNDVTIRYIEEMPFNGDGRVPELTWDYKRIEAHIRAHYPELERLPYQPSSTTYDYRIPGFRGGMGIIAAYSRTFCGTCNRIRITPQGMLKTCLYDNGVFDLKSLMRNGATDEALEVAILDACRHRAKDGFEAEKQMLEQVTRPASMSTIGG